MKLICEVTEEVQYLTEEKDGKKRFFIEGVCLQAGVKNRNGRVYPPSIMEAEVARYIKETIQEKRAYGELGHPEGPAINLDRVSHIFESLRREGNNWVGKAKICETPNGKIVMALIEDGAKLGVSSRGLGSLKEVNGIMEVQNDFRLATAADIVADPSAPDAFVRGIMEGVEYWYDIGRGTWVEERLLETTKKQIKKMSLNEINDKKLAMFESFVARVSMPKDYFR